MSKPMALLRDLITQDTFPLHVDRPTILGRNPIFKIKNRQDELPFQIDLPSAVQPPEPPKVETMSETTTSDRTLSEVENPSLHVDGSNEPEPERSVSPESSLLGGESWEDILADDDEDGSYIDDDDVGSNKR
ncbi:hypothetical protein EC973_005740 [Apophysomyces ossiformis]|uniref:Uncharacterized protein n=1 Tax=Apophysomyces ossiformis TaxID=679940 RepID=A0A8H7BK67_9FUNG|nr:hypothetical protein EC973_005740 [Apophysomyces ossiformis]